MPRKSKTESCSVSGENLPWARLSGYRNGSEWIKTWSRDGQPVGLLVVSLYTKGCLGLRVERVRKSYYQGLLVLIHCHTQ